MGWRDRPAPEPSDEGGLDDLFGEERFREYDDRSASVEEPTPEGGISTGSMTEPLDPFEPSGPIHDRFSPTVAMPVLPDEDATATSVLPAHSSPTAPLGSNFDTTVLPPASPPEPEPRPEPSGSFWSRLDQRQRVLLAVAAGLTVVLFVAAMFVLGLVLGTQASDADTATPGQGEGVASGPLEPGSHPWTALQGGECLDPLESVWAEEFEVVACDEPHAGQFMHRGEVGPEVTVYLDAEGWQGLTPALCDAGELLDLTAASEYTDLQWQLTYAGDATEWANGDRSYSCFITRSAGEPITGSLLAG